ncbi:MAG: PDZ domain-containing protein [Epsilonproteobacteria bacterium]|nr:PDZ domain-containing protein [Campylobacterota bacterium]
MKKLSSSPWLKVITNLLYIALFAKLLSLLLWWFLPANGVDLKQQHNYTQTYKRIDFSNMLAKTKVHITPPKKAQTASMSINNLILKGLYGSGEFGFAIVAKKNAPGATTVVGVGEYYAGYKLKRIEPQSVVFQRGTQEYVLRIKSQQIQQSKHIQPVKNSLSEQEEYKVQRSDIGYYARHPKQIWRDIAIDEVFEGKRIVGFKVKRVKKGSKMAQLGLRKGDMIIRANNQELNSYKAVMDLYANINKIDTLSLIVLRDNQEKEIIYEIH